MDVSELKDLTKLLSLLPKYGSDERTGARWQTGNVENLRVVLTEYGLNVSGSIAKFMYPSNAITVNWRYMAEALSKLSSVLGVDMSKATVSRLDASATFQLRYKPESYYPILGEKPYFQSPLRTTRHTVYYNQATRHKSFVFYDKKTEMKDDRQELPPPMQGSEGVMRYEARLIGKGTIEKELKEAHVTGAMLGDKSFFRKVQKYWSDNYFSIKKNPQLTDFRKVRTAKDIVGYILADYVARYGGENIENAFDVLQSVEATNRKARYEAKLMLRRILDKYNMQGKDDLKQELDDCVRTESAYL